ncbi:porin [Cytophagaceae bacterium YF14B1]|uniref:Porin n=1 Tax=Xanthocytophaga flava TaxID=3048013 RepID=A0AAE3QMG8_9BACT|nr:porin [Xanthocytophaga flavus]MDJ1482067.1 porin [Xanthocytophaga flavus]
MKKWIVAACLTASVVLAQGQTVLITDSIEIAKPKLTFSAFADIYYLYDFNQPENHERPGFVYAHSRHNEFALNNAVIGAAYTSDVVRGNLGLHTGTYVQRNYAAETINGSEVLKYIYQANVGVRLAKGLWLDAGILPSHIGYESALSIDNPTLTRSLMADNTPYYETGAKLTWDISDKLTISGLVLNGWQRIVETDQNKALGTQIQYKPTKGVLLNSSTFFGKEGTYRYYHNFYTVLDLIEKVTIIAAFDIGWQQQLDITGKKDGTKTWWNPNLMVRYKPTDKVAIAGRVEYYNDPNNIIIAPTALPDETFVTGFKTFSPSLNLDYFPIESVALRIEGRLYSASNAVFMKDNQTKKTDGIITTSMAFKF